MRVAICCAVMAVAAGCALTPGGARGGPAGVAETVEATRDSVWRLLPDVFAELGLPILEADSAAYVLASTRAIDVWGPALGGSEAPFARCTVPALLRVASGVGRTGSLEAAPVRVPPGRVMATVATRLDDRAAATRVETSLILSPVSASSEPSGEAPYCVSTGRLESRVADALRARLAIAETPGV